MHFNSSHKPCKPKYIKEDNLLLFVAAMSSDMVGTAGCKQTGTLLSGDGFINTSMPLGGTKGRGLQCAPCVSLGRCKLALLCAAVHKSGEPTQFLR